VRDFGEGVGVVWRRWIGYALHNIKTFIEAEEWKAVKSSVLIINSFSAEYTRPKAA
jgi:hypothetical protein